MNLDLHCETKNCTAESYGSYDPSDPAGETSEGGDVYVCRRCKAEFCSAHGDVDNELCAKCTDDDLMDMRLEDMQADRRYVRTFLNDASAQVAASPYNLIDYLDANAILAMAEYQTHFKDAK